MKTKIVLSAALGCSLLAFALPAAAQGDSNSVHTVEKFDAKFALAPTPDAPAGARSTVELKSNSRDGTGDASVIAALQGLDPGDYTINGVLASDGSTVALGTATVGAGNGGNGGGNGNGDTNAPARSRKGGKSKTTLAPPDGLDLADVQEVIVTDAGGTALLTADLTDPAGKSKASLNASVAITPGVAAPDATGTARLKSSLNKGARKNNFVLVANHVPADTTFTVNVDGTDGGTVTSNKKGKVLVKTLPEGITSIGSVTLTDETSAEVLRADF